MKTDEVCKELGLRPDYLAEVLKREVAHQHRELAVAATSAVGPELGGFGLQRISGLLHLIGELEAEWERQNPEESYIASERELAQEAADRRLLQAVEEAEK